MKESGMFAIMSPYLMALSSLKDSFNYAVEDEREKNITLVYRNVEVRSKGIEIARKKSAKALEKKLLREQKKLAKKK